MKKLVHGVGLYEDGDYFCTIGGTQTKHYCLWTDMLKRCYSKKYLESTPAYLGCSVSEDFKYFQNFAGWCESQIGFNTKGYDLDKDILYAGNKQYNKYSCVFVPKQLNILLIDRGASRGLYPVGVYWNKGDKRFRAQITKRGKRHYLGSYDTVEKAWNVYKIAKESYVREMVNEYKNSIDPRVYDALMRWEVV